MTISPWLSANRDNREGRFIQVGNSLLLDKEHFQKLSSSAKLLLFYMAMESGGKREFKFTYSAAKKYGLAATTFERAKKELQDAGFIERVYDEEYSQFKAAVYRFSLEWKGIKPAPQNGGHKLQNFPQNGVGQTTYFPHFGGTSEFFYASNRTPFWGTFTIYSHIYSLKKALVPFNHGGVKQLILQKGRSHLFYCTGKSHGAC